MLHPLFNTEPLQQQLTSGALILTANNRLASKIRQAWGIHQSSQGKTAWQQPQVYSLESWLLEKWQQACDAGLTVAASGTLITPQQEKILWEQAIEEDSEKSPLIIPANYASSAQQGYRIVQQWCIPDHELASESAMLCRWINRFRTKLKQQQLITLSDIALQIAEAFLTQALPQMASITLVGFQSVPPVYEQLLEASCQQLENLPAKAGQLGAAEKIALPNETLELQAAASWAAEKSVSTPDHRIGIVVPDLARLRPQIERVFRQHLQPQYQHHPAGQAIAPFNISAGIPLAETPMVESALALLSINKPEQTLADCCRLLNSPFWGADCPSLRSVAEIQIRELAKPTLRSSEFRYQLHRTEERLPESEAEDYLSAGLEQMENLRRSTSGKNTCTHWATLFRQQLSAAGWPGYRSLDSVEYQQLQHWDKLLEQLCGLDRLKLRISLSEALRQLSQLAQSSIFQPETPDSQIQILGLLEASGLQFDHLWVMSMDDRKWPQPCQPHPLLPVHLQRQHQTPRSNPERELELACELIKGFQQNATEVIFSYSEFDGDRPLRCSPLIEHLSATDSLQSTASSATEHTPPELESIDCSHGPALEITDQPIRGGSGIFDSQAACPFNAFAKYRLGATEPPQPSLGLSPMDRGSLLHLCLESLWQQLGSQQGLLSLTDNELDELLTNTITNSLSRWHLSHWGNSRPELLGPRFSQLEIQRLHHLLGQWLELEKQRPPFTVAENEGRHQITFSDLPLTLRIDRIDETTDGKQLIIDYKTGNPNIRSWLGERPEQPQLPLYALTSEQVVAGIAFASINAEQQRFIGIGEQENLLPEITVIDADNSQQSWFDQLEQWRNTLTELAEEFKRGDAEVSFHNKAAAQWQAELLPLNRWPEYLASQNDSIDNSQGDNSP